MPAVWVLGGADDWGAVAWLDEGLAAGTLSPDEHPAKTSRTRAMQPSQLLHFIPFAAPGSFAAR
ncbi:hypothetical protein J2S98_000504 [Arthrobacter oryzae]|nr:hypothetical protein [Arthrobacter oryzae]